MTPSGSLRVLLLADTHLGLDLPLRPRVERRRRGHDFLANLRRALEMAVCGEVDVVVHGGDLFDRGRISPELARIALEPLTEVAALGVPVFLIPGNHERARIPLNLWSVHVNLHILREPATVDLLIHGVRVAVSGFPFTRGIRDAFADCVARTGAEEHLADIRLLLMHQTVEGATVGAHNYTFRGGPDVIRGRDIPAGFAAVLSGHIHRGQVLRTDLSGRPLAVPVIYPGAVERTAYAERLEEKGYYRLVLAPTDGGSGCVESLEWFPLPARPMAAIEVDASRPAREVEVHLRKQLALLAPDSVVHIRLIGVPGVEAAQVLGAEYLKHVAPPTMNVDVRWNLRSTVARSVSGSANRAR